MDIEHLEKVLPQLVSEAASLPSFVPQGFAAFSPCSSLSLQLLDF